MPYTPPKPPESGPDLLSQVHIAVIRLDAKVDQLKEGQREQREGFQDHEARLRILETKPVVSVERFNALDSRPYVSPGTVWRVVGLLTTLCSIAVAVIAVIKR